jgi:hypothetical protein
VRVVLRALMSRAVVQAQNRSKSDPAGPGPESESRSPPPWGTGLAGLDGEPDRIGGEDFAEFLGPLPDGLHPPNATSWAGRPNSAPSLQRRWFAGPTALLLCYRSTVFGRKRDQLNTSPLTY